MVITMTALVVAGNAALRPPPGRAGGPGEPIIADVDGNGIPDRNTLGLIPGTSTCRVLVELGLADGGFGPARSYSYLVLAAGDVNCPDLGVGLNLDADPADELVVAWFAGPPPDISSTLMALDNFRVSAGFDAIFQPSFVGTADFDGDGRQDVYEWTDQGEGFATYLNTGTGALVPGPVHYCAGPLSYQLADFNRNGAMDVVIAYLEGCGAYFTGVVVVLDSGDQVDLQGDVEGLRTWGVEVVDANGDGIPDVATRDQETGAPATFLGVGDGTFIRAPVAIRDYPTARGTKTIGIRVLDNDWATSRVKVTIWTPPRYGTVKVTTRGVINYTPHRKHGRRDSFVYRLTDEGRTSNAAVSIKIIG
jgi:hypothetical protein